MSNMFQMPKESFWNNNSRYQPLVVKLEELIPDSGQVLEPRKNRALEKFRVASNCYHDLYNNGLCNRASEFRKVFGIASTKYVWGNTNSRDFTPELYCLVEGKMADIVIAAAVEQGIK